MDTQARHYDVGVSLGEQRFRSVGDHDLQILKYSLIFSITPSIRGGWYMSLSENMGFWLILSSFLATGVGMINGFVDVETFMEKMTEH